MSVASAADACRKILTFAEYSRIRHPAPYVVEIRAADTRLLLFGGLHSSQLADPMFALIEELFLDVSPVLALHEGTPPQVEPDRDIAIRRHGEAGLVRHLAARQGSSTASMDVPLPKEAGWLQRRVGGGDALVFMVVRQLASYNRKTLKMNFDAYFEEFFELIAPHLEVGRITWQLIESEHRRMLGVPLIAREVDGRMTDPTRVELPTQRIAAMSNRVRDEYMLHRLIESVSNYRRVFATVGVSHAVMLEPALRAALEEVRA